MCVGQCSTPVCANPPSPISCSCKTQNTGAANCCTIKHKIANAQSRRSKRLVGRDVRIGKGEAQGVYPGSLRTPSRAVRAMSAKSVRNPCSRNPGAPPICKLVHRTGLTPTDSDRKKEPMPPSQSIARVWCRILDRGKLPHPAGPPRLNSGSKRANWYARRDSNPRPPL